MKREERVEQVGPPAVVEKPAPPPRPSVIENADWVRKPSAAEVDKFYPERAQRMEKNGSARIRCVVKDDGSVSNCTLVSETPDGFGFGEAAMKMASLFKMRPQTKDGAPVGGASVVIPITFRLQ